MITPKSSKKQYWLKKIIKTGTAKSISKPGRKVFYFPYSNNNLIYETPYGIISSAKAQKIKTKGIILAKINLDK